MLENTDNSFSTQGNLSKQTYCWWSGLLHWKQQHDKCVDPVQSLQQPAICELHYPLAGEGRYLETNN